MPDQVRELSHAWRLRLFERDHQEGLPEWIDFMMHYLRQQSKTGV
jgi:hypothetical protein